MGPSTLHSNGAIASEDDPETINKSINLIRVNESSINKESDYFNNNNNNSNYNNNNNNTVSSKGSETFINIGSFENKESSYLPSENKVSVMPVTVLGVHTPNGDIDDFPPSFDVGKIAHHHSKIKSSRSKSRKSSNAHSNLSNNQNKQQLFNQFNHNDNNNDSHSNLNSNRNDETSSDSSSLLPALAPCQTLAEVHKNASCDQFGKCDISCNFCECVITCECENKNNAKDHSCKCQLHVHRVCEARTRYINVRQTCKCQKSDTKDVCDSNRSLSPATSGDSKSNSQRISSPCSSISSCSTPLVAITTFGRLYDSYSPNCNESSIIGGNTGILINGTTVVTPPQSAKNRDIKISTANRTSCSTMVCKTRRRSDWYKKESYPFNFSPIKPDGSLSSGPYDEYERLSPLPLQHTPPPILSYPSGNVLI